MYSSTMRWRKWLRVYLHLELLETRTPVSENLGALSSLGFAGGLAFAHSAPPPPSYPFSAHL